MVPSASRASIATSTRARSLSSGRSSPAAIFQFKSWSLLNAGIRRNGLSACCRLNQPTVIGVTAAASISRLANAATISSSYTNGDVAAPPHGERHRDPRADRYPDPLIGTETCQRRRRRIPAHREHDAAAMMGARNPHTARGRRILAGDDVEHEVAIGAAILDRANHPLPRQLDTELLGNFLAEFDLKSRDRSGLACKRQRVGAGAERQRAARSMTVSSERGSADARATMLDYSKAGVGRECSMRAEGGPTPDGAMHQLRCRQCRCQYQRRPQREHDRVG